LKKLASVLLENPELYTLIHSFNINALNFDAADRETSNKMLRYMREFQETGCHITERKSQKFFIHKPYLSDFQDRVFEASMLDFFQEPTRRVNISTYISQRRIIGDARELNEQKETEKKGMLMDIDPAAVNMVLFCPHNFEELNRDYGYVECIDSIRQLFQQGLKGEMSLLNLQNMMIQSSLRTSHPQNDLVFMSFMHYVIASSA
jgi:ADP-glucose pyrophosphorylase